MPGKFLKCWIVSNTHIGLSYIEIKNLWTKIFNGGRYHIIDLGQEDINELMQDRKLNAEKLIEMVKNCVAQKVLNMILNLPSKTMTPNLLKYAHERLALVRN